MPQILLMNMQLLSHLSSDFASLKESNFLLVCLCLGGVCVLQPCVGPGAGGPRPWHVEFLGQGSNPCHHSDNTRSLITRPPGNSLLASFLLGIIITATILFSVDLCNIPVRYISFSSFYLWEHWGLERLSYQLRVTELVKELGMSARCVWLRFQRQSRWLLGAAAKDFSH